jgi:hypothetical protein
VIALEYKMYRVVGRNAACYKRCWAQSVCLNGCNSVQLQLGLGIWHGPPWVLGTMLA